MKENAVMTREEQSDKLTCRLYLEKKRRFCKMPPAEGHLHCHMHLHLEQTSEQQQQFPIADKHVQDEKKKKKKIRVPCPVDPSHSVYLHMVAKHVKICNTAKRDKHLRDGGYYRRDINLGTATMDHGGVNDHGDNGSESVQVMKEIDSDAKRFMERYLEQCNRDKAEEQKCAHEMEKSMAEEGDDGSTALSKMLRKISWTQFDDLVTRIEKAYAQCVSDETEVPIIPTQDSQEQAVTVIKRDVKKPLFCQSFFDKCEGMVQKMKHVEQQSSIIGHIDQYGLLDGRNVFVEWGCGRAELSLMVLQALLNKNCPLDMDEHLAFDVAMPSFLLIDRAAQRRKTDTRIRMALIEILRRKHHGDSHAKPTAPESMTGEPGDVCMSPPPEGEHRATANGRGSRRRRDRFEQDERLQATTERLLIDIKDLAIAHAPLVQPLFKDNSKTSRKSIVNISKHLCGVATDLTLRCLHNASRETSSRNQHTGGVFIALCCHHRCTWQGYLNREFFSDLGFDAKDFDMIRMLSSWAICYTDEVIEKHNDNEKFFSFGRNIHDKMSIGRKCKRLIDAGRVQYLKEQCGYGHVNLVHYVDTNVSPENCMLVALPH